MKKLYFFLFLIIPFFTFSQTFVDDIDRVAIVVIDYCVDENGKRYNIKINEEKSTYSHNGWRLGCLDHFKKAKLYHPMKMTNKCWQSVYYFVNSKYKTYQLSKDDYVKCKVFHSGKFKYESPAYNETIIKRRKRRQIEKGGIGGRQVYKINWLNDYKYELETIKMSLEKDKHKEGGIISVEIVEILNEKTYLYKAKIINRKDSNYVFGLITKL
ncbi:hypothetical protein [uncultured Tenacibaculum sp.]|uniref:hypothetical protein n=1 Tax=uncultured Tenacibaculum sp. TaxID=174713 RepID=UPI0026061560|nr:hypothetical protein [uncultured Tenacibaculum sp.]